MPGLHVPHHYPKSCPLHQWCHSAISSSAALFSFCHHSFPAWETLTMSQLSASGDQNTGASASASVLPMRIQGWFPLRLTGLISLLSKRLSEVFSSTTVWRHQCFLTLVFFTVQFSQLYVTTGKTTALTLWTLVSRIMSAFQHTVYVCHSFPAKKQLSSDFMAAVTVCSDFRAQEEQINHYFHFSPSICHEVMEPGYHDLSFLFNI